MKKKKGEEAEEEEEEEEEEARHYTSMGIVKLNGYIKAINNSKH